MKKSFIILVFLISLVGGATAKQNIPSAIPYVTPPPAGKLPWPQHDPSFTKEQYDVMMDSLFIINNFGQYQGGTDRSFQYLHDGFDPVLPNGTKIFAVEAGIVRAITGGDEFYRTLIIEDLDHPGEGWSYTHINGFQVKTGDVVAQGTYLAEVHFKGVAHVHLSRVRRVNKAQPWSDLYSYVSVQPDAYFDYPDTIPPVFDDCFYYFRNRGGKRIDEGRPVVLSGDVDIVVGLRDPGDCAHDRINILLVGYGDYLAVDRIEYEISGNGRTFSYRSIDFSELAITRNPEQVRSLYKFYYDVSPRAPKNWDKVLSYYIVTNVDDKGRLKSLSAWRTGKKHKGERIFPNGEYVITVRAWDFKGNMAEKSETVVVRN